MKDLEICGGVQPGDFWSLPVMAFSHRACFRFTSSRFEALCRNQCPCRSEVMVSQVLPHGGCLF
ncbi:hypothetical protein KP509_37G008900 [Ceratopteris richardii]|uniref:Uncharacterized protein n=1 Tax=Ceratopteris richardii TaxID=49495 RepID=A0A8T2Q600_CERRI|nr:hypothetical protein KP509_37G008900 [Ceratopteris richardii]